MRPASTRGTPKSEAPIGGTGASLPRARRYGRRAWDGPATMASAVVNIDAVYGTQASAAYAAAWMSRWTCGGAGALDKRWGRHNTVRAPGGATHHDVPRPPSHPEAPP